jgi:hypothetical protein
MLYPPRGGGSTVGAFNSSLHHFATQYERALYSSGAAPPLLVWLSVGAISAERLPDWKRGRMTSELARGFNDVAVPIMSRLGAKIIDTYALSSAHPELSPDGVHYPGRVSHEHTQQVLRAICDPSRHRRPERDQNWK